MEVHPEPAGGGGSIRPKTFPASRDIKYAFIQALSIRNQGLTLKDPRYGIFLPLLIKV